MCPVRALPKDSLERLLRKITAERGRLAYGILHANGQLLVVERDADAADGVEA